MFDGAKSFFLLLDLLTVHRSKPVLVCLPETLANEVHGELGGGSWMEFWVPSTVK